MKKQLNFYFTSKNNYFIYLFNILLKKKIITKKDIIYSYSFLYTCIRFDDKLKINIKNKFDKSIKFLEYKIKLLNFEEYNNKTTKIVKLYSLLINQIKKSVISYDFFDLYNFDNKIDNLKEYISYIYNERNSI